MWFLAILNKRSAFSFLASHGGIVSILFPLRLRTWSDVRYSRRSIFAMQLNDRFSSRKHISLSSFSILSMSFLLKFSTSRCLNRSRFSIYCTHKHTQALLMGLHVIMHSMIRLTGNIGPLTSVHSSVSPMNTEHWTLNLLSTLAAEELNISYAQAEIHQKTISTHHK